MADEILGTDKEKKLGEQDNVSSDALKDQGFLGQGDLPASADKAPEHDQTPDVLKADESKDTTAEAPVDAPKADEITGDEAAKAVDEKKDEAVAPAPVPESSDTLPASSDSTSGGAAKDEASAQDSSTASASSASSPAESAAPASAAAEAPAAEAPKEDDVPKFGDAHSEAQAIVDAAPEAMDLLKEAGNKLAPAIKKFQDLEDKFHKLEDEAKARFQHLRQKATEAVAALEAIFKRG